MKNAKCFMTSLELILVMLCLISLCALKDFREFQIEKNI